MSASDKDGGKKRKRSTIDELKGAAGLMSPPASDSAQILADYASTMPFNMQKALLDVFKAAAGSGATTFGSKFNFDDDDAPAPKKRKANLADIDNPFPEEVTKGDLRDTRNNYKKIFAAIKDQITWDKNGGSVDFAIGILPRDFWLVFYDAMDDEDRAQMKAAIKAKSTKALNLQVEISDFESAKSILGAANIEKKSFYGSVSLDIPISVTYSNHKVRIQSTFKK